MILRLPIGTIEICFTQVILDTQPLVDRFEYTSCLSSCGSDIGVTKVEVNNQAIGKGYKLGAAPTTGFSPSPI